MKQSFSPTPWKVDKNEDSGDIVVRSKKYLDIVANCQVDSFDIPKKEQIANAKLIAAAPDLLYALMAAYSQLTEEREEYLSQDITQIENAIKKAV